MTGETKLDEAGQPGLPGIVLSSDGLGSSSPERAILGDTVACDVRMPWAETIAMRLDTPDAVAHANELLAGGFGWRLRRRAEHYDHSPGQAGGAYYMPPNV